MTTAVAVHSCEAPVDKVSPCSLSVYYPEEDGAFPKIKNLIVLEEPWYILYIALHEIEETQHGRRFSSTLEKTTSRPSLLSLSLCDAFSIRLYSIESGRYVVAQTVRVWPEGSEDPQVRMYK